MVRPLTVDIDGLEEAFEGHDADGSFYLDRRSGRVRFVEEDEVPRRLLAEVGRRFVPVPHDDPSDVRDDMEAFTDEVDEPRLQRRLRAALAAKDGGRRFRMVLWETELFDEWSIFHSQRLRARIVEWLASVGIGAMIDED